MNNDELMEWAWTCPVEGSSERLLLLAICRGIASGEHQTYAELERATNLHKRTIMRAVARLDRAGAIRIERSQGLASKLIPTLA